jgi:hypothetical protein
MHDPSTPCGQRFRVGPTRKAGSLRLSSNPMETPRRTLLLEFEMEFPQVVIVDCRQLPCSDLVVSADDGDGFIARCSTLSLFHNQMDNAKKEYY